MLLFCCGYAVVLLSCLLYTKFIINAKNFTPACHFINKFVYICCSLKSLWEENFTKSCIRRVYSTMQNRSQSIFVQIFIIKHIRV